MKKLSFLAGLLFFILIISVFFVDTNPPPNRILEANLIAAFDLADQIPANCGEPTFHYQDLKTKAPLFEGLGDHTFPISSATPEAQRYFNQGLNLSYGFNHQEAHRSFKEAARISPDAPMTYWGQAYALSPNINDYMLDDERKKAAYESMMKAVDNISQANDLERALIHALKSRFTQVGTQFEVDNEGYVEEMQKVAAKYSDHPDVLTLYADAIMTSMPWSYWEKDLTPKANTMEAMSALEKAIAVSTKHPGAHHFRIHLTELPFPEQAAESGDALAPLMPGAGHMVHMPSHAYIRVGRYQDAAKSNLKAIDADESYISQCYSQGIYPLAYYPHNIHFLWSAASIMGDSKTALAAARKTAEKVPIGLLSSQPFMQEFAAVPIQTYVRFGKWDELLTIPYPGDLNHYNIFWHYGRGIAFIRKGILHEAQEELDSLQSILDEDSYGEIYATINNSALVAEIAYNLVAAELLNAQGNVSQAEAHFKKAVSIEDNLIYYEPPSWHLSSRQYYGKFLVSHSEFQKAVSIYQEDLKKWQNNGWALMGLYQAYAGLGDKSKASETLDRFNQSWQFADVKIEGSVF